MRGPSDKLIETKLAIQLNKTLCVRVVGLICLKIEVTDKYIQLSTDLVSSVQGGVYALGLTCMRSISTLRSFSTNWIHKTSRHRHRPGLPHVSDTVCPSPTGCKNLKHVSAVVTAKHLYFNSVVPD